MSHDTAMLSASELIRLYRAKALSPVEATRAALEKIAARNEALRAFRFVAPEEALEAARQSEARWMKGAPKGLVDGVPTSVKDFTLTRGWSTLKGSRVVAAAGAPDEEDAPVASRLREHGAVLLGKTTLPELAWKGVTDSPLTGISRNPWDPTRTCGGSSGGAAIAAATGMGALHQGGDGAGSIRIPAAFCGIYGLKPTYGRVPRYPYGGIGALSAISHIGPMTRTVEDAALMMNVIARPDSRDWLALPYDGRDYRIGLEEGVHGLRIALSLDLGYAKVDPEIKALVSTAARTYEELGAVVEERDPGFADPREAFETLYAIGYSRMAEGLAPEALSQMDQGLLALTRRGRRCTVDQLLQAWEERNTLARRMAEFHETYDLLLTPQLPIAAFDAGVDYPPASGMTSWFDWSPFTYPFNFTQQPAASVPCGFTKDRLPVAFQLVGRKQSDALVLRASRAFEAVHPFRMPSPPQA